MNIEQFPIRLIENAAAASQDKRLLENGELFEPVYLNVYKPLADEIAKLRSIHSAAKAYAQNRTSVNFTALLEALGELK